jgi:type IV pilus assembly protein PilO
MKDWPWYGFLIIAVVIFALFYMLYAKPQKEKINTTRDTRIRTEQEVRKLRAKKQELDQIEKEIEILNATLAKLEAIIPQKEEIDIILKRIEQLGYDTRLNIIKFAPQSLVDKNFYQEKPIAVSITGNYHNLATFFDKLSNFSRIFNVESFSIRAARNQTEATTISADWTAKTYVFKETPTVEETAPPRKKVQ